MIYCLTNGEIKMRDRVKVLVINDFVLAIDKDHLGYYRGKQALEKGKYRGWHYHIESEKFSQEEIMQKLELFILSNKQAQKKPIPEKLAIGTVEYIPSKISYFESKTNCTNVILWLSSFNGKLHIEANKINLFTKNLISKEDLIIFLNLT